MKGDPACVERRISASDRDQTEKSNGKIEFLLRKIKPPVRIDDKRKEQKDDQDSSRKKS